MVNLNYVFQAFKSSVVNCNLDMSLYQWRSNFETKKGCKNIQLKKKWVFFFISSLENNKLKVQSLSVVLKGLSMIFQVTSLHIKSGISDSQVYFQNLHEHSRQWGSEITLKNVDSSSTERQFTEVFGCWLVFYA